ncbi:MAG: hypothetical protein EXR07_15625 [Acetobacteraceae bacterium]|nr:hypothetical protein [Acetobacteraceae bacterium]
MSVYDATSGVSYATLSGAISGSLTNDVLLVPAGSYVENFPDITHSLTIEAIGGLASLTLPQPVPLNGRAILNVPGNAGVNLSISGLEISGARRPEPNPNGAGILFEFGNGTLTVTNSYIHDNQEGILTGGPTSSSPSGLMSVTINHSQISDNGATPGSSYALTGQDHNLYIGAVTSFTLTNSYVSNAQGNGHEVKSRALSNTIVDNRIQDGPSAVASYVIDLPNGGASVVTGNVIEKGSGSPNRFMVHFGGEGTYTNSSLLISGNTFINDRGAGATGLLNQTQNPNAGDANFGHTIPAVISGNIFYGVDEPYLFQDNFGPPFDIVSGNSFLTGAGPALDTSPGYDVAEPGSAILLVAALLGLAILKCPRWFQWRGTGISGEIA